MFNLGFWDQLLKNSPVIAMSPMDGVTDAPMRYMSAKYGRPAVVFTEFISVDALAHAKDEQAVARLMRAFIRAQDVGELANKPYEVAQVFGCKPELFYQAAVIIAELGYDGMDLNMGCPAHKVEEHGSGAGLIRTPETAKEIVRQAKRAMRDWAAGRVSVDDLSVSTAIKEWVKSHRANNVNRVELPVSLKTRIGVDRDVADWWMGEVMSEQPAVVSLHGRTLRQMYQGQADWEAIGRAARVVHDLGGHILGNGDIQSLEDGLQRVEQYGVDGFLIGRAAEGNPGVFVGREPDQDERMRWLVEHTEVYERVMKPAEVVEGDNRWFLPMRKHLAWYCKGFPGAVELRTELVRAGDGQVVRNLIVS